MANTQAIDTASSLQGTPQTHTEMGEGMPQEMVQGTSDVSTDAHQDHMGSQSVDAPGVLPDVAPGVLPNVAPGVLPDDAPDVLPDVAPGVLPNVAPGSQSDLAPKNTILPPHALPHGTPTSETVATTSTAAPLPMDGDFTWSGYFQAVGTLCLLLALLWAAVWALRKYGKFNFIPRPDGFPRDGLRMEAQLPLGPRKSLMVVHFLNRRLLLGVTDHQITLIKEVRGHDNYDDDDNEENFTDFKDAIDEAQRQNTDT